ncbi:ATP-binding cassette domain-containing protein [Candidatus Acetothermia bacterium]|nr:ATP-binding cassette domain-containing protein [Candidatus Acetothermia bacterium]MBI3643867.1 ATP-binding cassette domain-containing protein [Candidatus Acetothermia bacterium]
MPIMVQVSELSLSDAEGRGIFKDLHFRLNRGEWGCLCAPPGLGKSLFLRMLMGQCKPDHGQILVDERNILRINAEKLRQLRRRLGVVLEDHASFGNRVVRETLLFKLRALDFSEEDASQRTDVVLELVELSGKAGQLPQSLSESERELFALALALSHDPVLLLLDEPLQKISSPQEKEKYLNVLVRIHLRKRLTTLMTTAAETFPDRFPILCFDLKDGKMQERQASAPASEQGEPE